MRHLWHLFAAAITAFFLLSCEQKEKREFKPVFAEQEEDMGSDSLDYYDLLEIRKAGTLIGGTLSGPDTYFEYHGTYVGLQFQLAQEFANYLGVKLQMETAPDTAALLRKLQDGEIDFIALEMPRWETRSNSPLLREAIHKWWKPVRRKRMEQAIAEGRKRLKKRQMRPVMIDLEHGIISQYDDLFRRASSAIGWDWRLIAAQCYQESGFDPRATSWVGARGLMQIMPATGNQLGVSKEQLFDPETNVMAASRYLRMLCTHFADIHDRLERIKFTLAAYNGGTNHVRDAMALTDKYGGRPDVWSDVSQYILKLSDPAYYRDPVVHSGYMRGNETYDYVERIINRWAQYRGSARSYSNGSVPSPAKRSMEDGEYRSRVKSAEEWLKRDSAQISQPSKAKDNETDIGIGHME